MSIRHYFLGLLATLGVLFAVAAAPVQAACGPGEQEVTISVDNKNCIPINSSSADIRDNPIYFYLKIFLRFLAAGVGLAVTAGFIVGSFMYITARANAGQVEKAKVVFINSVIGLLLFIFMFAILQFLIPGGVFG